MQETFEQLIAQYVGSEDQLPVATDRLLKEVGRHVDRLETELAARARQIDSVRTELRDVKLRYESLVDYSPAGIFHSSAKGETLWVNAAWTGMTGLSLATARGEGWIQAIHPQDRDACLAEWGRAVADRIPISRSEFRMQRPAGEVVWVQGQAVALFDEFGEITGYVGTVTDITELKRASEAVRRSDERYRMLFEQSKDVILFASIDGRILDMNTASLETFGYDRAELPSLRATDFYDQPEDRAKYLDLLERHGYTNDVEMRLRSKDGRLITMVANAQAVRDESGEMVETRVVMRDVSAQRELERQLHQAQKLEAVGRLAGGVSHDFNNLLTAILGYCDLLERFEEDDASRAAWIAEIRSAGERGAAFIRQLLSFSRHNVTAPQLLDLGMVVDEVQKLLRRLIGENVELVIQREAEIGLVLADASQVEQVIVNLAVNARDAMPATGTLTIQTSQTVRDGETFVLLRVTDTGCGMEPEVRDQIFEPFFTTKGENQGTGLGLSTVHDILRESGASIEVQTEPGHGATFELLFPVVEGEQVATEVAKAEAVAPGCGTILLVEDEPSVRSLLQLQLERLGYTVIPANDGESGLQLAREQRGEIDLLLSDVVTPRLSGIELADCLKLEQPELKVVLMSGYTEDLDGVRQPGYRFLQKPFELPQLAAILVDELDHCASMARS